VVQLIVRPLVVCSISSKRGWHFNWQTQADFLCRQWHAAYPKVVKIVIEMLERILQAHVKITSSALWMVVGVFVRFMCQLSFDFADHPGYDYHTVSGSVVKITNHVCQTGCGATRAILRRSRFGWIQVLRMVQTLLVADLTNLTYNTRFALAGIYALLTLFGRESFLA
jgi:hypothetical protein